MSFRGIILFVALILLTQSCNAPVNAPDVSAIKAEVVSRRFDKDIYSIDTGRIGEELNRLKTEYPDFLDFFLDTVMSLGIRGNYSDTAAGIREGLMEYLTYPDYRELQNTIEKRYPDTRDVDAALSKGFQYQRYYFPQSRVPRVYYVNHIILNLPAFCVDSNLACICLDMFLGNSFAPYRSVRIPDYLNPHLRKEYIPVAFFSVLYQTAYPFRKDDRTLLDMMIQRGKEQLYLHKVLPQLPDSVLFGFSAPEMEWCAKNEALIYNYFIQRNLLYSHEERQTMPYITDGPFAVGLGSAIEETPTPGNIGSWLGYRIVRSYAEQHPAVQLRDLIDKNEEPARFLQEARYKPR